MSWIDIDEFRKIQKKFHHLNNEKDYTSAKESFREYLLSFKINDIPVFGSLVLRLDHNESNHGLVYFESNRKMTLFEHTLDFLIGCVSGTGLNLDFPDELSKIMLIAGIYHDVGKMVSIDMHITESIRILNSDMILNTHSEKLLARDLIIKKELFFSDTANHTVMHESIINACNEMSTRHRIDAEVALQMLYAMFLADSTTLYSKVYSRIGNFCDKAYTGIHSTTFDSIWMIIDIFNPST
jgi:hypothetical protein